MKLIRLLNSPYPTIQKRWSVVLSVSLFVTFFILVFQPFGLQRVSGAHRLFLFAGYGAVTFIVLVFNLFLVEAIFSNFFRERTRTLGKQIGWQLWMVFNIGLANYFYSICIFPDMGHNVRNLIVFQLFTLAIGIFPVTIITIITHNYLLRKNLQSASFLKKKVNFRGSQPESRSEYMNLVVESGKESVVIPSCQLMYIESIGNYAAVHWYNEGKEGKKILRTTLKQMLQQVVEYPFMIQCHRAFLVNLKNISDIKGNAQGYQLRLFNTDRMIPVSRSYIQSFNRSLLQVRS
jgi:hypothetical protein